MLVSVGVYVESTESSDWYVYDTDNMCIVDSFGAYQTKTECDDAIRCYLE